MFTGNVLDFLNILLIEILSLNIADSTTRT